MSRTYKDMPYKRKKRWRRILKNSLYKKILQMYSEDIIHKRKDRTLNGVMRARLKRRENK